MSGVRGVRLNRNHSESVLARIKTSQIVNRLQDHVFGKVELTRTQESAARFLVERTLARAESPKKLEVSGKLSLEELISQASAQSGG